MREKNRVPRLISDVISLSLLIIISVIAIAPAKVVADITFEEEAKIQALKTIAPHEVFQALRSGEYLFDKELLTSAINAAFVERKKEAISYAMNHIQVPRFEEVDSILINRKDDFYVAKMILTVFKEDAITTLISYYSSVNNVGKGNIILVLGSMLNNQAVRSLLVNALDDSRFCEERVSEVSGDPLRISDVAYNQLVLHDGITGVLRTIGSVDSIETRNFHIETLKNRL